jgi:hypothetical protein
MNIITIALLMLICEIILAFLFAMIAQVFYKKLGFDFKSIFKGLAERLFLSLFLFHNMLHALTFFSALKLATRLKHNESNGEIESYNDYYLLGNLMSVSMALLYVYLWNQAGAIETGLHKIWR